MPRHVLIGFLAVLFVFVIGQVKAEDASANAPKTTTTTVGHVGKLAWPFLAGNVRVASTDDPKMKEMLAASFVKSGYTVISDYEKKANTFTIFRNYRGKASNYVPPTANTPAEGGGWGSAIFSLGLNVLIGQKMGLINTSNIFQSNANTLVDTARRAGEAYGTPQGKSAEEMASATKNANGEINLVVYQLCFSASNACAYALSAGASDLDVLDAACFKDGILKLAGQDSE